jgi:hypothetical protein
MAASAPATASTLLEEREGPERARLEKLFNELGLRKHPQQLDGKWCLLCARARGVYTTRFQLGGSAL